MGCLSRTCKAPQSLLLLPQDGRKECVMFDKITSRISKLCYGLNKDFIEPVSLPKFLKSHIHSCLFTVQAEIPMKVIAGVYSGVTTVELDTLAAETAASMTTKHPDYAILAARIAVSNLHKETKKLFSGKPISSTPPPPPP